MTSLFRSRRTGQGANAHHPVPAPRRKASRMLCWSLVAALAGGVGWGATHLHTTQSSALQGKPDTVAIAAASTAHDGIAAVDLEQIVAASDSVYALAANHQAVYEWSPDQNNWLKVRGATQKLYAGGDSVYAIATGSGDITKYSGEPGDWPRIGGPGATFAATTKHLYGISTNGSMVMEYSGRGETWKKVGDRAKDLYAGPDSTLYATNPDTGNIYKYDGKWSAVGGPGATFAVTDNNFYGLTPDRTSVVEYDADKKKWRTVGGPAGNIFASNTLYATDRGGDLYKYNGRPGLWNRLSGPAAAFATNGNLLYRLAPDHRSVQKYTGNGATEKWTTLGAPAAGPAPSRAEKTARFKSMNQSGDESRKGLDDRQRRTPARRPRPLRIPVVHELLQRGTRHPLPGVRLPQRLRPTRLPVPQLPRHVRGAGLPRRPRRSEAHRHDPAGRHARDLQGPVPRIAATVPVHRHGVLQGCGSRLGRPPQLHRRHFQGPRRAPARGTAVT
nr:hypothetical protein OG513_38675 [Streptomyces sp. NBC_00998]